MFGLKLRQLIRNIQLGKKLNRSDQPWKRLALMSRVALGQSKMAIHPIPAALHLIVYLGFIIVNIEVLEIILDGLMGTHRIFGFLGLPYDILIAGFEVFAIGVLMCCLIFLVRRSMLKIRRFSGVEMKPWPKTDAKMILIAEISLMSAFLIMNAADYKLQLLGLAGYRPEGFFLISQFVSGMLPDAEHVLILIERGCWWFHIIGILIFLNYLPYSKHMHIFFAFPNTYFSKLEPMGDMGNMASVTNEVKSMLIPTYMPVEMPESKFGAKDVTDLSWVQLLNAYTCTECGRCTSVCPANITGKLLSPRKVMMDTRDRLDELGSSLQRGEKNAESSRPLLDGYISREEIWACTSCNACVQECPVNIDPLSIIVELRRYAVMEESSAPPALNTIMTNIENNQAPWKYAQSDRLNWMDEEN
jgi:heterodisulfide reductase subunit C